MNPTTLLGATALCRLHGSGNATNLVGVHGNIILAASYKFTAGQVNVCSTTIFCTSQTAPTIHCEKLVIASALLQQRLTPSSGGPRASGHASMTRPSQSVACLLGPHSRPGEPDLDETAKEQDAPSLENDPKARACFFFFMASVGNRVRDIGRQWTANCPTYVIFRFQHPRQDPL
jgi:hypothetical protein